MKILLASSIDPDARHLLATRHAVVDGIGAPPEALQQLITDCEAVIFRSGVSITADLMAQAPRLQLLIRAGSGLDNVDLEYIQGRGLTLERIAAPGARAVAELTFGLMLVLARQIIDADRFLRGGHWAKEWLKGKLLQGKTLGIVGVGNIGGTVADMGVAWGMSAIGCVAHPTPERRAQLQARGIRLTGFDEVVAAADYLGIFVPLNTSTRALFDAAALARMKPGALLINMARGGIVDEQALFLALQRSGGPAGAALDVHQAEGEQRISPLATLPQVILTPHIGAMTIDTQREIGRRILEIVDHFSAGRTAAAPPATATSALLQKASP